MLGLEEAKRKGTNRKVVRTDPTITHNKFEPPWEVFEGQHSIGDVKQPPAVRAHGLSLPLAHVFDLVVVAIFSSLSLSLAHLFLFG